MATDDPTRGSRPADGPVVGQTGARFGGAAGRRSRAATSPPVDESAEADHRYRDDETPVGQSGARFPGVLSRWRHRPDLEEDAEQQDPEPAAGGTGAKPPPPAPQPVPRLVTAVNNTRVDNTRVDNTRVDNTRVSEAEWAGGPNGGATKESSELVRPYFWTKGRTASRFDLSFETLVSATSKAIDPVTSPEHRTILAICMAPHSVAEVAALLSMPLGVARVVLGDMADAGSVMVHRTAGSADAAPDIELMRRVLAGLQRL